MQSHLGHIVFSVRPANLGFYKDLMGFLGWKVLYEDDGMLGVGGAHNASLWFARAGKESFENDYDAPGVNHVAIHTAAQADVDATVAYLTERGVASLFETPRHRPDFAADPETYYQVMFESPDRILFEVVYIGPKAA
jgi:catechol 2,3-dioxygenase-like lactoylglutathione lyase family enzyme